MKVNENIAIDHGLNKEEFKKICNLLKRVPNITELGIFSAMWNEHCSYKSSKIHLKNLPTKGKIVIQKFIKGEEVSMEHSGLSKREWNELMENFSIQEKII